MRQRQAPEKSTETTTAANGSSAVHPKAFSRRFKTNQQTHQAPAGARPVLFQYPALPRWEMALCWLVTVGTLAYGWACVWAASSSWQWRMGHAASVRELPVVGVKRFKDESNWEWFRWSPFAIGYLPFLLGHTLAFNLLPRLLPSEPLWSAAYTAISMAISAHIFGARLLALSVVQGLAILGCTVAFRKSWVIWLSAVPVLYVIMNKTDWVDADPFLVLLFVSYTLLSYISFCLELARKFEFERQISASKANGSSSSATTQPSFAHLLGRMLLYAFYQPYLFSLIVLYPEFERQLAQRNARPRPWRAICWKAARVAFWWALCELCLHFLYFGSIALDPEFMNRLPKDQFVSIGMAMGAFFHLKYVVIFGLPAVFALLDGLEPPEGPICISRVSLYSKIWRGFDRGLYAFFKQYIFVPICWPSFSLPRKLAGLCVSFTFVLLWHGFHHHNLVWIALNIVELTIEFGAKAVYSLPAAQNIRAQLCSDLNFRRLLGWLQIFPFAFGLYSNFYFLGGSAVGWLFVRRIFWEETVPVRWPFLLLIGCGYFYMQVAMEIERRWPERRQARQCCPVMMMPGRKNEERPEDEENGEDEAKEEEEFGPNWKEMGEDEEELMDERKRKTG